MNLFVDTSALLSFYDFSRSRLKDLRSIVDLQGKQALTLWVTDQLLDEFARNRESRIKPVLRRLLDQEKAAPDLPVMLLEYEESKALVQAHDGVNEAFKNLVKRVESEVRTKSLDADKLVNEILDGGKRIALTDEQFANAQRRAARGNPPGKGGSLGDALHWEGLLQAVPQREELHLIAVDGDFGSDIDKARINPFLSDEWRQRKAATAYLYLGFADFLRKHFPEKKEAADRLALETKLSRAQDNETAFTLSEEHEIRARQLRAQLEALPGAVDKLRELRPDQVEVVDRVVTFLGPRIVLDVPNDTVVRLYRALVVLTEPLGFRRGLPIDEDGVMVLQAAGIASSGPELTDFGVLVLKSVAVDLLKRKVSR